MKQAAGIIGYGVLGKAYAQALDIKLHIDLLGSNTTLKEMCAAVRWVLICVPTPADKAGNCDTSIVEYWVREISKQKKDNVIVIRSTVTPGTADRLMKKYGVKILSAPEFLTESTAVEDALDPDLEVIGSKRKKLAEEFISFQKKVRKKTGGNYKPYFVLTKNITAEFIKYSINSFYATKVIFANQLYDTAQKTKVDYDSVMDAMYHRKWIGDNHLKVMHKGKRGYAGKCLPKDSLAFANFTKSELLKLVVSANKKLVAGDKARVWRKILDGVDPRTL